MIRRECDIVDEYLNFFTWAQSNECRRRAARQPDQNHWQILRAKSTATYSYYFTILHTCDDQTKESNKNCVSFSKSSPTSPIGICKIRWTTTWICLSKRRRFTIGLFWALSCRNPGGDRSLIGFKDGSATTLVASCFTLFLVFFGASTSITSSAMFIYLKVTQLSF